MLFHFDVVHLELSNPIGVIRGIFKASRGGSVDRARRSERRRSRYKLKGALIVGTKDNLGTRAAYVERGWWRRWWWCVLHRTRGRVGGT